MRHCKLTYFANVKGKNLANAAWGRLSIQLLDASKVGALYCVVFYYPISEENEPSGDSLLPRIGINSRDERGTVFELHSTGAMRQNDNTDISRSSKLLES